MRIRKNARLLEMMLSSSAYPPEAIIQTTPHVCQLNQSPWDVLPISTSPTTTTTTTTTSSFPPSSPPPRPNSTSSSYPTQSQLEGGRYSLSGNAGFEDSMCAVESLASMRAEMAGAVGEDNVAPNLLMGLNINSKSLKKMTNNGIDDNDGNDKEMEDVVKVCSKTNGKGWQCRKEAKKGYSLCENHINHTNNNNSNSSSSRKSEKLSLPPQPSQSNKAVKRRGRGPGKKASTVDPYEYYFYSGFGPLWGRSREERMKKKNNNVENSSSKDQDSLSQQIDRDNNEVEEAAQAAGFIMEDEDDSSRDDNGRKRARKPVKNRSLKSLM